MGVQVISRKMACMYNIYAQLNPTMDKLICTKIFSQGFSKTKLGNHFACIGLYVIEAGKHQLLLCKSTNLYLLFTGAQNSNVSTMARFPQGHRGGSSHPLSFSRNVDWASTTLSASLPHNAVGNLH